MSRPADVIELTLPPLPATGPSGDFFDLVLLHQLLRDQYLLAREETLRRLLALDEQTRTAALHVMGRVLFRVATGDTALSADLVEGAMQVLDVWHEYRYGREAPL